MPDTLTPQEWEVLLDHIHDSNCTPFLGAGVCFGVLPMGGEVAETLAERYNYPFDDKKDLPKVAQYIATNYDPRYAKRAVLEALKDHAPPVFDLSEPHAVLADLPLPLYITTNYDSLMYQALVARKKKPRRELLRWNELLQKRESIFDHQPQPELHPATPVVFHIHGHDEEPHSLVLTEDDFLEFAEKMSSDREALPAPVAQALTGSALLFIGYKLADWNLRVLLRGLRRHFRSLGVVVMPPPQLKEGRAVGNANEAAPGEANLGTEDQQRKQQEYLSARYGAMNLKAYWGTAKEFCADLHRRYTQRFPNG